MAGEELVGTQERIILITGLRGTLEPAHVSAMQTKEKAHPQHAPRSTGHLSCVLEQSRVAVTARRAHLCAHKTVKDLVV